MIRGYDSGYVLRVWFGGMIRPCRTFLLTKTLNITTNGSTLFWTQTPPIIFNSECESSKKSSNTIVSLRFSFGVLQLRLSRRQQSEVFHRHQRHFAWGISLGDTGHTGDTSIIVIDGDTFMYTSGKHYQLITHQINHAVMCQNQQPTKINKLPMSKHPWTKCAMVILSLHHTWSSVILK